MKKFLVIIFISTFSFTYSQDYNFAWLSDIYIGLPNADKDLQNVIADINKKTEIKFVVVTGNLTANGRGAELNKVKELLDSLNVPYYVIPGPNDVKLTESGCTKFKETFQDDKFSFDMDGVRHIGINSSACEYIEYGHFSEEDLNWLKQILSTADKQQDIYLYIFNPLNSTIDNWFLVSNLMKDNIKVIFTGSKPINSSSLWNKITDFNGIPGATGRSTMKPSAGEPKSKKTKGVKQSVSSWGYTYVNDTPDSLFLYEASSDSILNRWGAISKTDTLEIPGIDSLQFNIYSDKSSKKWEQDLNTPVYAPLYADKDRIFAVTKNGVIYCYDINGILKWKYDTRGTLLGKPVRDNDVLSLATFEGDLFSFNVNNGKAIQVLSTGENLTSQLIKVDVVNSEGLKTRGVVVGCLSGKIICYDMYSFEQIWENNSAKGMIESEPLLLENKLIFKSRDNFLYCIDVKSGVLNWRLSIGNNTNFPTAKSTPVSDGKNVYISATDKNIFAVDLLLGRTVWRKKDFNNSESIGISGDKQKLFIKSTHDKFYIVSAKDGKLIGEINSGFGTDFMPGTIIEWNNNILFASKKGIIYLTDEQYNCEPLIFTGTANINSIINVQDNLFAASNIDGKIIVFEINQTDIH